METLTFLLPIFTAILCFVAVLTGLGFVFNLLLKPVKIDIEHLKEGQAKLESKLDQLLAKS